MYSVCDYAILLTQAEELFRRLQMARGRFNDWVVLGSIDMDTLVEQHCISVTDYERNFKLLKSKGREAEKLPQ